MRIFRHGDLVRHLGVDSNTVKAHATKLGLRKVRGMSPRYAKGKVVLRFGVSSPGYSREDAAKIIASVRASQGRRSRRG